jgi:hypothetical protein
MSFSSTIYHWIQSILNFIRRNPGKLGLIAFISIIVSIYLKYFIRNPLVTNEESRERNDPLSYSQRKTNQRILSKSTNRSRLLLRVRRQFDLACRSFLPTLKKKIFEIVDMNQTIQKIKELRASIRASKPENSAPTVPDAEDQLWEDVKVSAFAQLLLTLYLLPAITTLLRIQLHILARSFINKPNNDMDNNSGSPFLRQLEEQENHSSNDIDGEMFKFLVEGTYKQLFSKGLKSFASGILERTKEDMKEEWNVKEKVKVEFDELRSLFMTIRKNLEEKNSQSSPGENIPGYQFTMMIKELFIRKFSDLLFFDLIFNFFPHSS